MNLQAAPDAPWILHAGAAALLYTHIGGGALGMASGFVAIFARKGAGLHRRAGSVFTCAMIAMAGVGAGVAPFLDEGRWTNTLAGVFALYLTLTGWSAGRPSEHPVRRLDRLAAVLPLGVIGAVLVGTVTTGGSPAGESYFPVVYVFAALCALAVVGDVRHLRAGGLTGPSRRLRHIWRTSLALFIATGSYFLGQPDFVPDVLNRTGLNMAPPLLVMALLAFWMVRTRFPGLFRRPRRSVAV